MKHLICILLLLPTLLHAQQHDTRANLDIRGWASYMTVSPGGRLWLSGMGHTYYADSINGNWHDISVNNKPIIYNKNRQPDTRKIHISNISFFNKDTAIAIITPGDCSCDAACYRSSDGGAHWSEQLGKDTTGGIIAIENTLFGSNAWLTGWKGIFFTANYGHTWTKIATLSDNDDIFRSMHMATVNDGIAATHNSIYITHNNWCTYSKIPMPELNCIAEKVLLWGRYIVVNAYPGSFYSDTGHIAWHTFPGRMLNIEASPSTHILYTLMASGYIRAYSTPEQYTIFNRQPMPTPTATTMILWGDTIYTVLYNGILCRMTTDTTILSEPYTTDHPLRPAYGYEVTRRKNTYAYIHARSLVVSPDSAHWYRACTLPFDGGRIIRFASDTTISLWDEYGHQQWWYYLRSNRLVRHACDITPFLAYPVQRITLQNIDMGCYTGVSNKVVYNRIKNTDSFGVTIEKEYAPDYGFRRETDTTQHHNITIDSLKTALRLMSDRPGYMPTLADFRLPGKEELKQQLPPWTYGDSYSHSATAGQVHAFISNIDTISPGTLRSFLDFIKCSSSQQSSLEITVINTSGDTLRLVNQNYCETPAYRLPWIVTYHQDMFASYDPAVSRFTQYCQPPYYYKDPGYDNTYFLKRLAEWLWEWR